jgi:acyl dehydratase
VTDRYYEDFKVGDRFVSGGMTMTEAGIIEFARQWDPQPFHIDVEFATKWTFGGLIASGLHTMAVTLKLWLEMGVFRAASLGSPGIGEVQFPRPVRPGDTLRVVTDIVELRLSASKPDRGIARVRQVTINQRGEQVMEQETTVFLKRRPVLVANRSARSYASPRHPERSRPKGGVVEGPVLFDTGARMGSSATPRCARLRSG